ncbi:MAG: DUF885 domain-containing protein [Candidatus Njordarchaeia archaeon]
MSQDENFRAFIDEIFKTTLEWNPVLGTYLGLHEYDPYMGDYSKEHILKEISTVEKWFERLQEFDVSKLNQDNRIDWELINRMLKLNLFFDKELKIWERQNNLGDIVISAIYLLFIKDFAPFEKRLESITSRLNYTNKIAEDLKKRCTRPVKTWSKIASEVAAQSIGFLRLIETTAKTLKVPEESLEKYLNTEEKASKTLMDFKKYLDEEIIPEAPDDWAIGAENLRRLLDMRGIKESFDELLNMANKIKQETLQEIQKLGNELYPNLSVKEIIEKIKEEHPKTPEEAIEYYKKAIEEAREILRKTKLVPLPEGEKLIVVRTPKPFVPLLPQAGYMSPGKFEDQIGIYFVTAEPDRLKMHYYASIKNVSFHEAYPGHHTQLVWANKHPSIVRSVTMGLLAAEFVEGWAHYVEELMVKKGYGDKKVRLAQLEDQLFRAHRVILDISMQTGKMTYEEAVEYMKKELGWPESVIRGELNWYTQRPGYPLSYLYGKMKIKAIRRKFEEKLGDKFNESTFHNAILEEGNLPLDTLEKILERKLL